MKHKIREEKKREQRIGLVITVAILITIISISGFLVNSMLNQPSTSSTSELKAAIVDHLSLTRPNQTFIETATNILEQANYSVKYHPGEEVTVKFYRNLAKHGYRLIILRVHSTATEAQGTKGPVALFTSELYSKTKYVHEQITDQLCGVAFSMAERERGIAYFGINPSFVSRAMNGRFQNTIIITMGCEGLTNPLMAEAFIEKGAKVYIGWDGSVSASHTDQATTHLLQHLILEKRTIQQAVGTTMKEVETDPAHESHLTYYPLEAGQQTIEYIKSNR